MEKIITILSAACFFIAIAVMVIAGGNKNIEHKNDEK